MILEYMQIDDDNWQACDTEIKSKKELAECEFDIVPTKTPNTFLMRIMRLASWVMKTLVNYCTTSN